MIRTVLAVVVAVGLLATASPAFADAQHQTTRTELETVAEQLDRIATGLATDSTASTEPSLAARTTVTIGLPSGFGSAPIEWARIGCRRDIVPALESDSRPGADCRLTFAYRLRGSTIDTHAIPDATLAPEVSAIEVTTAGTAIQLRYVRRGNTATVELAPLA
ncbi:hypothetical protein SAMN05192561_101236 [Halopenitus malekzadehii]|uniref:DUF7311 domain-containing protein n=1 Tax=Halopenitus malekzadehii TaxID=1267564 RepID=A0A1H6HPA6_9EURY|nr:hypothetical protein [Halopenitus malekzadehii]SEH37659.1 hypothetical protein SAMN05192561_101236 [Halopenitus malekzadehii]